MLAEEIKDFNSNGTRFGVCLELTPAGGMEARAHYWQAWHAGPQIVSIKYRRMSWRLTEYIEDYENSR